MDAPENQSGSQTSSVGQTASTESDDDGSLENDFLHQGFAQILQYPEVFSSSPS